MAEFLGALFIVLFVCIFVPLVVVPIAIVRGWCLHILWGWFAVPVLHVPALTTAQAIGIAMVAGMFQTPSLSDVTRDTKFKEAATYFGSILLSWGIGLGFGWILKTYYL